MIRFKPAEMTQGAYLAVSQPVNTEVLTVSQKPANAVANKRDRKEYMREYMRKRRAKK